MRPIRPPYTQLPLLAGLAVALSCATLSTQALATPALPPQAAVAAASATAATAQQALDSTQALVKLHKRWQQAQEREQDQLLPQLVAAARARRQQLQALLQSDPASVLRLAVPETKQLGMPAGVLAELEQPVELSGQLEVFYEDREDGSHRLRQFLNTPFGERFELHFAGQAPQLSQGQAASLHGVLLSANDNTDSTSGDLALNGENLVLALGADTTSTNLSASAQSGYTFGEQKTLVININFANDSSQPWTPEQARGVVFDDTNAFIQENSFNQTWLSGDVTPWLTLPIDSSSCDTTAITEAAKTAATAAGYDLTLYNRRIYAMPYSSGCGFSGVGSVGGWPSSLLINGSMQLYTVAHELGHNLGLYHSHSLECGSEVIGSNCSSDEYGDSVDIMGHLTSHYTAFQKERLGWLDSSTVETVTTSGVYQLESYAAAQGSLPKALKIANGSDPLTGLPAWYYLEYRAASGYDALLANFPNVQNGVVVHTGVENYGNSSNLLDMTPGSGSTSYADTRDPALEVGYSFSDDDTTLTTESVDGSTAQVDVQLSGSVTSCNPANPALSLTPGESAWVAAGTPVTYTLTLTNQDSSACADNSFSLSDTVPAGWSATLGSSTLTLAPGESQSTTLQVTSPSSAGDGFYAVSLAAVSGSYSASATATYVVDNPVVATNNAPVAANDSASTTFETPVTLAVLANDTDADGDTLSVTAVSGVNGTAIINANGTITFTPASGFSGSESFSYTVSDGNGGSDSATVSVSVAAAPNTAPVALADSASTAFETPVTLAVLANDSDADGDTLSVTAVSGVNGTAIINANGTITFTPASGFSGSESFSYTISDGNGGSASANVSIAVAAAPVVSNSAPVAVDDSASTAGSAVTIAVLGNDSDPDGDTLQVVSVTPGSKGTVTINSDGTLTYTPAKSFKSSDTFSYTVSDGTLTASANVTVTLSSGVTSNNGKGRSK